MLLKNNTWGMLGIFLESPTRRFQLRELARISGISTTGVKSSLSELMKLKLIFKSKDRRYEYYEANRDDLSYRIFKKFFNVKSLHETGAIDYIEKELNHPEAIFLFGSAARGEDVERSDFDIFVLAPVKKEISLEKFGRMLKREIRLLVMSKEEFERAKKKNPELVNNIVNGINLQGFLEVV